MSSRRVHRETEFSSARKVEGADRAVQQLRALGEDIVIAAKVELAIGVDAVSQDAKNRVPVLTGKLKESIKYRDIAEGAVYDVLADAKNENGIAYGQFVEFSPKINRPFLYPAIKANKREIKKNIKLAVQEAVKKRCGYSPT